MNFPLNNLRCCRDCGLVRKMCICNKIKSITASVTPVILQHPKEHEHKKNTARFIPLTIDNTKLFVTDSLDRFLEKNVQLNVVNTLILFPHYSWVERKIYLEEYVQTREIENIKYIIIIDASWRKAKRILLSSQLAKSFLTASFYEVPKSRYLIRRHENKTSLATIESLSLFYRFSEPLVSDALDDTFNSIIKVKLDNMPNEVKIKLLEKTSD